MFYLKGLSVRVPQNPNPLRQYSQLKSYILLLYHLTREDVKRPFQEFYFQTYHSDQSRRLNRTLHHQQEIRPPPHLFQRYLRHFILKKKLEFVKLNYTILLFVPSDVSALPVKPLNCLFVFVFYLFHHFVAPHFSHYFVRVSMINSYGNDQL